MTREKEEHRVLILFAHPALQNSRVNRELIRHIFDLDGVTVHDLYEAYPDFHIQVKHEQNLLVEHDVIVFHHPIFWFSTPAILKEWQDLVLEHGWAYGKNGTALHGKTLLSVISTGGRESLYRRDGFHRHTVKEFLAPVNQMAYVCGMRYLPPFIVHGTHTITKQEIAEHGKEYRRVITALRDGKIDLEAADTLPRINSTTHSIIVQ